MANFSTYFPTLLKHEGGLVDNPNDKGGLTKYGVTFSVWIAKGYDKDGDGDIDKDDLKLITPADAEEIAKKLYWDKIKGDAINSQSIAEFIFDWGYLSGTSTAIKQVQRLLGLEDDGVIGPNTLKAINGADSATLFNRLKAKREAFFRVIVNNNPSQQVFLKGWLNRNNSFVFKS